MKMLSIDGGGIRGVLAISILKAIEEETNRPIADMFEVIAGTSTGSIVAASIALNISMDNILESYKTYGEKIFIRQAKVGLFKSVYNDRYLRRLLKKAFGEKTLADIEKPLLIPAVDITHGKPFIHRSNYGHAENGDLSIKVWDAVLSSCSAPVYFPPNNVENRYLSIDGGLWANNPSLVCITDAVHYFNISLADIHILSIGTGQQRIDFSIDSEKYWGVKHWLPFHFPSMKVTPKLLDLALNLSSESISYHCQLLLNDHYLRINGELGEEVPFDEVKYMAELIDLGRQVFNNKRDEILYFLEN
ncbi:CBASS cGAMP-activated phospholipase [Pseudoneobacillus rhizosphaerae]|uniref:CUMP-AMP-activated phospholipase n=1 Tax=Pseudoneobacillus rhizosphaerae TaxID=2880968 RepID=A0A9C7G5S6_9BACI|nr:CBASS cGAMP-activated phospholipase [Pseudoneobacillus rhizosphaerae]CAG9606381.1 cUMP-AMP-activated phospholipase [Pseudoneobacillus rhizosphaerae]